MDWVEPENIRLHSLYPLDWLDNHLKRYMFHNFHMRGMTVFLMDYYKDRANLVGAEIGVFQGTNSLVMLQNLGIMKLFCVDPYVCCDDYDIYKQPDSNFLKARDRLRKYKDRVVFVKKFSADGIDDIPDDLDFVYIDGNHSYDFVKEDIELYYPKIKVGGVLGGHDFYAQTDNSNGVARAVLEFVDEQGLQLFGKRSNDWWVVKKKLN